MMTMFLLIIFFQLVLESLPVSSSGHVLLISRLYNTSPLQGEIAQIVLVLDHVLHLFAILVMAAVFYTDWQPLFLQLTSGILRKTKRSYIQRRIGTLFMRIVVCGIIIEIITLLFYGLFSAGNNFLLASCPNLVLLIGFGITSMVLLSLRLRSAPINQAQWHSRASLDIPKAILLGLVQGLAFLPGVSRLGITFATGCWLNIAPKRAFQLSCLIHVPLCIGGFIKGLLSFSRLRIFFTWPHGLVILLATIISYYVLKKVYRLSCNGLLWVFGLYVFIPISMLLYLMVQRF